MKVLFLGVDRGTSAHRAAALRRLGHEVRLIDPSSLAPGNRVVAHWNRNTGGFGLVELVRRRVLRLLGDARFDICWVDGGGLVNGALVRDLRRHAAVIVNYNIDDPFGNRDASLWREFRLAVPEYDLLAVMREVNIAEAYAAGARNVIRVFMSADELVHAPRQLSEADLRQWGSEVVFVGTAFPERGPFLARLVRLGVPLTIYGDRYRRLPEWRTLRPYWKPETVDPHRAYPLVIAASKVCLGLLSKGNRDQHTTRSMEIPSLGRVLCAQRTDEHQKLYCEDEEAVFWSSAEECAAKCAALMADEKWRNSIAERGRARYLANGWTNERVVRDILNVATADPKRKREAIHGVDSNQV